MSRFSKMLKAKKRERAERKKAKALSRRLMDTVRMKEFDRAKLTGLHIACLNGHLSTIRRLVESGVCCIDSRGCQGHRPIHMVLSAHSAPNTIHCLKYLLNKGANVNVLTDAGLTPLHQAASRGLLDCTQILVKAGANVFSKDRMGLTPLDLARIWGHQKVARYLRTCMWLGDKMKETEERKEVELLYYELLESDKDYREELSKVIVSEWANRKGVTLHKAPRRSHSTPGRFHTRCALSPPTPPLRPWAIYSACQPPEIYRDPDLRKSVMVWWENRMQKFMYNTRWDRKAYSAPQLDLDILRRVLFPRDFYHRVPFNAVTRDIMQVPRRANRC
ncbi:ankyrin repeat domain-containing protein 53 isoform X1 [Synchiropus splendidus]|uniref:ankyrin repeat domain-containing protein 53 isoform X1 n=2 Tax=Synchiropus splendidus TaxID=270530 RepID=UPI00237EE4E2|nr:ankyrin repeat domain-containing protein 53 isoform X1 [Synchiropus splendidus]